MENHNEEMDSCGGNDMDSSGEYIPEPNPEFVGLLEACSFVKDDITNIWWLDYPTRDVRLEANFTGTANGHYCGTRKIFGDWRRMVPGDVSQWFRNALGQLPPKMEAACI